MNALFNSYLKVIIPLVFLILVELFVLFPGVPFLVGQQADASVEGSAARILRECEEEQYRPTCYEEKVPDLLDRMSIGDVFNVVRFIRARDHDYQFCHVLAHKLGERVVAGDPARWFDVIPQNPTDGLCSNGFIHGAAVARFSQEVFSRDEIEHIIPDIADACEARGDWHPTGLDQAICYHGIGHVLVYLTDADLGSALDICDTVALKDDGRNFLQVCEEGVFMQIFQPLEPEDYVLIDKLDFKPTKETLREFCDYYARDDAERSACWREGWPLLREELQTANGIVNFCKDALSEREEHNCYATVLSIRGRGSLQDPTSMATVCDALPEERHGQCYAIGAGTTLEEDRSKVAESVSFCARAQNAEVRTSCYEYLARMATFNFRSDSPEIRALCEALPDHLRSQCLGGS